MTNNHRETIKVICLFLIMTVGSVTAFNWLAVDRPTQACWTIRIIGTSVSLAAFATFLYANFPSDPSPNYLRKLFKRFFDCEGFCFVVIPEVKNGCCYLSTVYQNRHDRPCNVKVWMRLSGSRNHPIFHSRILFELECYDGEFGVVRIPISVPKDSQGGQYTYELWADVDYFSGRGNTLFYGDGKYFRSGTPLTTENRSTKTALNFFSVLGLCVTAPPITDIVFPSRVAETLLENVREEAFVFWKSDESLLSDRSLSKLLYTEEY